MVVCKGHVMLVERLRSRPRMARVDGFLTVEECDHLIRVAQESNLLHRSLTAAPTLGAPLPS